MLRTFLRACTSSRRSGRSQRFTSGMRFMSRVVHQASEDSLHPSYNLDESDIQLLGRSLPIQEENIRLPFPHGPDFLDVQVGEALPPAEHESDWGVQYIGCDEKLKKQVRIVRKLGYGADGSVWMGYEEPVGPNGREYVAVKVFSLAATAAFSSPAYHNEVLTSALLSPPSQHPGRSHLVKTHWHAIMKQTVHPNLTIRADRLMSVMELCGPSIKSAQAQTNGDLPFDVWRKAFRDILLALDHLHNERNIVHGDLKPDDILLVLSHPMTSPELSDLAEEPQLYQRYSDPDGNLVVAVPTVIFRKDVLARDPDEDSSLLREVKEPISMPLMERHRRAVHQKTERQHKDDDGISIALVLDKEADWKLCDFGSASPKVMDSKLNFAPFCNPRRQAPEIVLGLPWDEKIDIWALGCAMHEVLVHGYIFNCPPDVNPEDWGTFRLDLLFKEDHGWYDLEDHLASMMVYSGTRFPLWMAQAFQDAQRDKADGAEEKEIFDYSTGELLRGEHISPLFPETRASLQEKHPWLGRGDRNDELLYVVLMRSMRIRECLLPGVEPSEPTDTESLRDAVDLIKRCLTVDPRERPSAKELLEDPFFKDDDSNSSTG